MAGLLREKPPFSPMRGMLRPVAVGYGPRAVRHLVSVLVLLISASVSAQGLVESARTLQQVGEHEAALAVLQRALDEPNAERGRILHRMAESELALGRNAAAAAHLREALALSADPWVAAHTAELATLLARATAATQPTGAPASGGAGAGGTTAPSDGGTTAARLPPALVQRFGAESIPPLPRRTEWRRVHRLQAFAGGGLFAPDDDFGNDADALVVFGAEVTGGLASIFSYRAQARFGVTLLNVEEFASWDPPGPYVHEGTYGERRDFFVDVSLGARVYVGAGLFVGVGGRLGLRRVRINDRPTLRARGYDEWVEGRDEARAHQLVTQGLLEFGWRSDHIEFRVEGSGGRPRASVLGLIAIPFVTL